MLLGCLFINDNLNGPIIIVVGITFLIGLIIYEINNRLRVIYIILSLLVFISSFLIGSVRYNHYLRDRDYYDRIEEGQVVRFQGELALIEKKTTSYYLYFNSIINEDMVLDSSETIILQSDSDDLPIGATAIVEGKKEKWNVARNEGNFDEKSYYNSVGTLMKVKGTAEVVEEPLVGVGELLYCLRENVKQAFISNLPGEEGGIVSAMTLGDKSELDAEVKDLFKLSGLAHILAISGLHISIVGMSIYRMMRRRGTPFGVAGVISSVIVVLYGMLTFGGVSTIRAVVMFLVMILADILGEGYDSLSAIGAAMIYVLTMYPYSVDSVGFIFSFGAVTGIAVVVNPLVAMYDRFCRVRFVYSGGNRVSKAGVLTNNAFLSQFISRFKSGGSKNSGLEACGFKHNEFEVGASKTSGLKAGGFKNNKSEACGSKTGGLKVGGFKHNEYEAVVSKTSGYKPKVKERIIKALFSGILIQIVTLPIVCTFYYEIPTYVVLLNCLVIPLLGALLGISLIGGVTIGVGAALFGVFLIGTMFDCIGGILLWGAHIIVYLYEMLAYISLQLPMARIVTGSPDVFKVIIYYLVLIVASRFLIYKYEDVEKIFEAKEMQLRNGKDKRYLILCLAVLSACVIFITHNYNCDEFEMDMIDVGQGDGIFVAGDNNYFFDGGSTDVKKVGTYRILPFLEYKGIRRIDYWFVSHVDSDHISGLLEALDSGYPIDNIVVDKYMLGEDNYQDIKMRADNSGVNIIVMETGDVVAEDNLRFTCVFAGSDEIYDINGNSLAILGEYEEDDSDIRFFIGGDMTVDSEKCLLSDASEKSGDYLHSDILTSSVDYTFNDILNADDSLFGDKTEYTYGELREKLSGIDILKVSHHGSKSSSSEEFLQLLSPKISIISAGVNNRYHHPSKEVVSRLDELGIPHMCTQDYGRLHIYLDDSGVNVGGYLR